MKWNRIAICGPEINGLHFSNFQLFLKSAMSHEQDKLQTVKDEFVAQWGALGTQWGINRTMAQIHALLFISTGPLSTDEVMEKLEISRGNAHTNLKELVAWGLVRTVLKKGERKEFFEAEKDVWQMFTIIARERKRREIEPTLGILRQCAEESGDFNSHEGRSFHLQMRQLEEFIAFASKMADRVSAMKHGFAVQMAAKLLG
jgi:DNA-binding transcriptional regulator GbsR (MarR family)